MGSSSREQRPNLKKLSHKCPLRRSSTPLSLGVLLRVRMGVLWNFPHDDASNHRWFEGLSKVCFGKSIQTKDVLQQGQCVHLIRSR